VVLLHGLGRGSGSMKSMAKFLESKNFEVHNISYPSRKHSIATIARDLAYGPLAGLVEDDGEVHFVTHSMGGIIFRYMHQFFEVPPLGKVVMLGPPNHGSEVVDHLKNNWFFKFWNGPAGLELSTSPKSVPNKLGPVEFPLAVIAGNKSLNPLFSHWIKGPDDGKVSVESTKVEGQLEHLVLPVNHTFMANNRLVQQATLHFLKHGWLERSY
jgi:triacylglycerol lipase